MKSYIKPDEWMPVDNMRLEDAALRAVLSNQNNIVVAGPGAGKTELLAQRACFLLQTNTCKNPRRILAISFKTDAAYNLKNRVEKRCGKELSRRLSSKTYDAFAKSLIDRFRMAIPETYRPQKDYMIIFEDKDFLNRIENVIKRIPIPKEIAQFGIHEVRVKDFVEKYLTKYKLPINNEDKWSNVHEWLIPRVWLLLLNDYHETSGLTFKMISRLAEYLVRVNPMLRNALVSTYSHVFLDEFQDTTDIQYQLLKTIFLNTDSVLTAVGDNKQRIMIWAGALNNAFDIFASDFTASSNQLIMNHRSAPRLVEVQKIISQAMINDEIDIKANSKWDQSDGICEIWLFEDSDLEAFIVADNIYTWIQEENLLPSEICIIAKHSIDKYADTIIKRLKENGIKARNEAVLQDFLSEECIILIMDIIFLSNSRKAPLRWGRAMDLIRYIKGYDGTTSDEILKELEERFSDLLKNIKNDCNRISGLKSIQNIVVNILRFLDTNSLKNAFTQYKRGTYFSDLMNKLCEVLWKEYQEHKNWVKLIEEIEGKNSIPIMTIHKSKGLEYDTVIFIGLEDGAFWSFEKQQEEDTNAFFVALSRAKKRVIFTFSEVRTSLRYPNQSKEQIKTFYDLLQKTQIVDEKLYITNETENGLEVAVTLIKYN